ncbi:MAG: hypothetical protein QM788_14690 [Roseateles sp.]|uniref:hypothetical protein n=1 Tax=Roseateles sp. TaxID=1971397 RepID=UPI0039ECEDD7
MDIQGFAGIPQAYGVSGAARNKPGAAAGAAEASSSGTQVSFSDRARALASSDSAIAARLESIKAKPAVQRSSEEVAFVQANDGQLAGILAKDPQTRTADNISQVQQAGGFVNTMAKLSADEKRLYDDLVAQGDSEAVRAMNLVALSRTGTGEATLPAGQRFDPGKTAITADNVRQLFSQMFVSGDGRDAKSFDALAKVLDATAS